jgi:hypothetical protein
MSAVQLVWQIYISLLLSSSGNKITENHSPDNVKDKEKEVVNETNSVPESEVKTKLHHDNVILHLHERMPHIHAGHNVHYKVKSYSMYRIRPLEHKTVSYIAGFHSEM